MQSDKLNESESRPNITLKKIGQELDVAETKCFTLKSELNYMMGVCRKAQTEIKGSRRISNILYEQDVLTSKNLEQESSVDHYNCNNKNADTSHQNPKYAQFSSRKNIQDDNIMEKSESKCERLKKKKQEGLLNVAVIPTAHLNDKLPPPITMTNQSKTVETNREYRNLLSCYPQHVHEYVQSKQNVERPMEELTSKTDEDYLCTSPSTTKKYIENTVLNQDVPKNKHTSKMQIHEKNYTCKSDNIISKMPKMRKRKGKLRSSTSKSTVTTKDTNLITRKEAKRRRCRGHDIICQHSILPKHPKMSNDVVEIFHNTTLKSVYPGVSNKHSKLDREAKNLKNYCTETANPKTQEKSCFENVNHECQSYNKGNQQNYLQTLNCQNTSGTTSENVQEQKKLEKHPINSSVVCETYQRNHTIFNKHNDSIFIPSYEMPTLASKLKCSNKSYFNKFNFQNIPFVVGTSVTPSHNLGLNIQQVLSVMKTRQPIANIAPLLIHKLSGGMKPTSSILLEQINGQYEKSVLDLNSQINEIVNSKETLNTSRGKKLSIFDLQQAGKTQSTHTSNSDNTKMVLERNNDILTQFYKDKSNFHKNQKIKQQSSFVSNKSDMLASARSQQGISRVLLNKEDNLGDHEICVAGSHNSKEIRFVLINLHDQFEDMNRKYEKLQLEVGKSNNQTLVKELSILEKELNVKEEEINAVIGLYKEVMTLKQQMKMLHEKRNLVCIETESFAKTHQNPSSISVTPGKSHLINMTQIINRRKGSIYKAIREPPTSMQLAALLRQIQTFHKQLQLTS